MATDTAEQGSLEQRLRRLEALFIVLFAHNGDWPEDERFLREVIVHMGHLPDSAFFEEMLHLVFRRRPRGRLAELEEQISKVETVTRSNQACLHEHLSLALLGPDTDDLPMRRIVPMRLCLKKADPALREVLFEALSNFAGSMGLVVSDDLPAEKGTGFKKWFARTIGGARQAEVREQLEEGMRALQLCALKDPDAEPEQERAKAAVALLDALERTGDAVLQVGPIVLVKSQSGWVTRMLSQTEQIHLEKNPELLKSPEDLVRFLGAGTREARPQSPAASA
jgi:hypothetical protein